MAICRNNCLNQKGIGYIYLSGLNIINKSNQVLYKACETMISNQYY
jgi:hypothetical protein